MVFSQIEPSMVVFFEYPYQQILFSLKKRAFGIQSDMSSDFIWQRSLLLDIVPIQYLIMNLTLSSRLPLLLWTLCGSVWIHDDPKFWMNSLDEILDGQQKREKHGSSRMYR